MVLGGQAVRPNDGVVSLTADAFTPLVSILVGTYNRLSLLRQCVESVYAETSVRFELIITDAGSTDGTIPFLQELQARRSNVYAVLTGRKVGQARAINDVLGMVRGKYVCWISDDNRIINRGIDVAARALEGDPQLGMVGLKVRDVVGPHVGHPYIGGISVLGILNVNQGMLPTALMKELGGFDLEYSDYGIDPDLTARVLLSGWDVAYTKPVCIEHHREWAVASTPEDLQRRKARQARSLEIYLERYGALCKKRAWTFGLKKSVYRQVIRVCQWSKAPGRMVALVEKKAEQTRKLHWRALRKASRVSRRVMLGRGAPPPVGDKTTAGPVRTFSASSRDWMNVFNAKYISVFDRWRSRGRSYHLVQRGRRLLVNAARGQVQDSVGLSRAA